MDVYVSFTNLAIFSGMQKSEAARLFGDYNKKNAAAGVRGSVFLSGQAERSDSDFFEWGS